jgi:hypothetical protein
MATGRLAFGLDECPFEMRHFALRTGSRVRHLFLRRAHPPNIGEPPARGPLQCRTRPRMVDVRCAAWLRSGSRLTEREKRRLEQYADTASEYVTSPREWRSR